ncbi:MAG: hypothetical protein P0107_01435 [Nitrosomonas sp.]|nr:hypothetical protein [Nitrosomonas sp.]
MGLTETEAEKQGIAYESSISWAASGRAITMTRDEGMTKLLFDKVSKKDFRSWHGWARMRGADCRNRVGFGNGADMQDIRLTIHPHPLCLRPFFLLQSWQEVRLQICTCRKMSVKP